MPRQPRGEEYGRLVLATIRDVRNENNACTSREIGRRLQVPHQLINRQLEVLAKAGLVGWTPMPGSIHLSTRGGKVASGAPMPELPTKANLARAAADATRTPEELLAERILALEAALADARAAAGETLLPSQPAMLALTAVAGSVAPGPVSL